jgi:hypothetical protein
MPRNYPAAESKISRCVGWLAWRVSSVPVIRKPQRAHQPLNYRTEAVTFSLHTLAHQTDYLFFSRNYWYHFRFVTMAGLLHRLALVGRFPISV